MLKTKRSCIGVVIAAMLAVACSAQHSDSVPLRIIQQIEQCTETQPATRLINSEADLAQLLPQVTPLKHSLTPATEAAKEAPVELEQELKEADRTEQWILVAWGQLPHPGYQLIVTATNATFNENELILPVKLQQPDPDRMYPQMTITPCLILAAKSQKKIESFSFKPEA